MTSTPLTEAADPSGQDVTPTDDTQTDAAIMLRKAEFLDRVAERAGLRKNQIRPVLDAALAVLGDALEAGEAVQLPPLGRIKVRKMTENETGASIVCQLRRNTAMRSGQPQAEPDEADDS